MVDRETSAWLAAPPPGLGPPSPSNLGAAGIDQVEQMDGREGIAQPTIVAQPSKDIDNEDLAKVKCSSCSADMSPRKNFCSNCGHPQNAAALQMSMESYKWSQMQMEQVAAPMDMYTGFGNPGVYPYGYPAPQMPPPLGLQMPPAFPGKGMPHFYGPGMAHFGGFHPEMALGKKGGMPLGRTMSGSMPQRPPIDSPAEPVPRSQTSVPAPPLHPPKNLPLDDVSKEPSPPALVRGATTPAEPVGSSLLQAAALSAAPALTSLKTEHNESENRVRVHWTVEAKKVKDARDKVAVSPAFKCPNFPGNFKIILLPKASHERKGGACFKSAKGQCYIQVKWGGDVQEEASVAFGERNNQQVNFKVGVRAGGDKKEALDAETTLEERTHRHNFAAEGGVCRISSGGKDEDWDLAKAAEGGSRTIVISLEVSTD